MNKEFVIYRQGLKLKELGFDEPCLAFYEANLMDEKLKFSLSYVTDQTAFLCQICSLPLWQQAFDWFRTKHGLHAVFIPTADGKYVWQVRWFVEGLQKDTAWEACLSYEKAQTQCLDKLIEIIKS